MIHRHRSAAWLLAFAAWLTVALLVATGSQVMGQEVEPDPVGGEPEDLGPWLEDLRRDLELPALAGAILTSEGTLAWGVTGVRRLGDETAVEPGDLWHIGSLSKSFTATLTARLVEAGKVRWETTLGEVFPEAAESPYSAVSLIHLLSHHSGLPANPSMPRLGRARFSRDPVSQQRLETARELFEAQPTSEPGTDFLYSNAGYVVAGAWLERITERPWEELVRKYVLDPLGLTSAGFGPPGSPNQLDQPRGHRGSPGELTPVEPYPVADNPAVLGPAGTLHLSLGDLVTYAREHLRGELGRGALLKPETYQRLHAAVADDYAYGWVDHRDDRLEGRRVIWHNGSNTLWYALVALVPELDLAAILLTNGGLSAGSGINQAMPRLIADWHARVGAKTREE